MLIYDTSELIIEPIVVRNHYAPVCELMRMLHEHEKSLYPRTALWSDIADNYMQHVMDMQAQNNGQFWAAWWRDRMIAFIFGYTEEEDESRCEEASGTIAYISDGYVLPEWRGKGVYRTLNQQIEMQFTGMGISRFTRYTLWNNEPMKALLQQEGYKLTRLLYEKWV